MSKPLSTYTGKKFYKWQKQRPLPTSQLWKTKWWEEMLIPFQHTKKSSSSTGVVRFYDNCPKLGKPHPYCQYASPALWREKLHTHTLRPAQPLLCPAGRAHPSAAPGTRNWPQNSRWLGLLYPFIPVMRCVHLETSLTFSSLGTGIHAHGTQNS